MDSLRSNLVFIARGLAVGLAVMPGVCALNNITYTVPASPPWWAATLDPAPVSVSFEFFTWPEWIQDVSVVFPCLDQLSAIYGQTAPIRIGGTTQDRALYDPHLQVPVLYSVPDPSIAPDNLTYGPQFLHLIADYGGQTMLGLNRGDGDKSNTFKALKAAQAITSQALWAIELGNEPDLYLAQGKADAVPPWDASQEGSNQAEWHHGAIDRWDTSGQFIAAGSYAYTRDTPAPNTDYLINYAFDQRIEDAVKVYSGHLYSLTGGQLDTEMNHALTVADLGNFTEKIATASSVGRPYILGETNFHAYNTIMDASFGAALVTLDRSLRAAAMQITKLFYHQGTVNAEYFNWWSTDSVNMPFYGGYLAAMALTAGDQIVAADDGTTSYAVYFIYNKGKQARAILINTDYYSGTGPRTTTVFTLSGLKNSLKKVKAIRMTAESSNSMTPSQPATIAGQFFSNQDCSLVGKKKTETVVVSSNQASFELMASEAVMVYL